MSTISNTHDDEAQPTKEPFAQMPEHVLYDTTMKPITRLVYAALDRHWRASGVAFPKQERLAALLGVSVDTVQRSLAELEGAQIIKKRRRGQGRTNVYTPVERPRLRLVGGETPRSRTDAAEKERRERATVTATARRLASARGCAAWDDETRISFATLVTELQDKDAGTARVLARSFPTLVAADFDYALERLWEAREHGVGPNGAKEPLKSEAGFVVAVLRDIANGYEIGRLSG